MGNIKYSYQVEITQEDLDSFYEVFKMGKKSAGEYCPTPEECDEILIKDLKQYLPFMLWIEHTGWETAENAKNRRYLRLLLYKCMIVK